MCKRLLVVFGAGLHAYIITWLLFKHCFLRKLLQKSQSRSRKKYFNFLGVISSIKEKKVQLANHF